MIAIDDARPLLMRSPNSHTPKKDAATPRTAEDTICVIGDVTFMDNKLAMLIKNPTTPAIADPHKKVLKGLSPTSERTGSKNNEMIDGSSPERTMTGTRRTALYKFVYHDK